MRCERVQKLIVLQGEIESAEKENRPLRDHLRKCVRCQIFAAEMTEVEREFELLAPPQFSAEFFQTIRNNVRREISAESTSGKTIALFDNIFPRRAAMAAVLVLFILLGGPLFLFLRSAQSDRNFSNQGTPDSNLTNELPPSEIVRHHPAAVEVNLSRVNRKTGDHRRAQTATAKAQTRRRINSSPNGGRHLATAVGAREKQHELASLQTPRAEKSLRLDLQTSDPNVRIIWFAPVAGQ